jgi:hypothetical protein
VGVGGGDAVLLFEIGADLAALGCGKRRSKRMISAMSPSRLLPVTDMELAAKVRLLMV